MTNGILERELCLLGGLQSVPRDKFAGQVRDDFHYGKFDINSLNLDIQSCFYLFREQTSPLNKWYNKYGLLMIGFNSLLANYLAVTLDKLLKPSKPQVPRLLN